MTFFTHSLLHFLFLFLYFLFVLSVKKQSTLHSTKNIQLKSKTDYSVVLEVAVGVSEFFAFLHQWIGSGSPQNLA